MELVKQHCKPCEGGTAPLSQEKITEFLSNLTTWKQEEKKITKIYRFKNYWETIAFVNAVAWVSHREDHHPDMMVSYNTCQVTYFTHAIQGLSENDFICAAKLDILID